jgi:tyrosyl-tRNA synthetase
MTGIDGQVTLLMQGTEYGDQTLAAAMERELRERLRAGRPLRVYAGFDPRTTDLHLGHTVPIRKLRQYQELGHHVMLVVGTFTSTIGDPSDQDRLRAVLTTSEAEANGRTYAEQAFRILDPARTEVLFNHRWLADLTFADVIGMACQFSLQQILGRESFRARWDSGDAVWLHETFYSLMQAHDASHLDADVQVGGSDQLFNIMTASRGLMESRGQKPNIAIILGLLPGTDGRTKMSKSLGNHIPILSTPEQMYGKIMSLPDEAMAPFFRLVTPLEPAQIADVLAGHPRDAKMRLGREIVGAFHDPAAAQDAERKFVALFRDGAEPDAPPEHVLEGATPLVDVLVAAGLAASRSEARRLVAQGAVSIAGVTLRDAEAPVAPAGVLRVGRRRFVRLVGRVTSQPGSGSMERP